MFYGMTVDLLEEVLPLNTNVASTILNSRKIAERIESELEEEKFDKNVGIALSEAVKLIEKNGYLKLDNLTSNNNVEKLKNIITKKIANKEAKFIENQNIWKISYLDDFEFLLKEICSEEILQLISSYFKRSIYLSDVDIPVDTGDFRLIDRKVVNVLKSMSEGDRFIRGMVSWVGYKQFALTYERAERFSGESKYPFWKMARFATDGILSFSIKPLRLSMFIGFASSFLSALGILYALFMWFVGTPVVGWTLMFIAITFFSGVQLVSLGVIGEYVGRSYMELKNRPLYVVRESKGVNE